jgi:hypothetical protein
MGVEMEFSAGEGQKRCLNLTVGMRVRLKPDAFPHVKIREWEIMCFGKDKIILKCSKKNYTLDVLPEDIESNEP